MEYGTFCSTRETFGVSINRALLTPLNSTNCSLVDEKDSDALIPLSLKILTGVSWLAIIAIGTAANFSVLCVIGTIKTMRTIPNWLLFNLAVADSLMTLVAYPLLGVFQTFHYPVWQMPPSSCYVLNCFTHIGALASGASLAAISVHRFIVIRFSKRIEITKRHLFISIGIVWIVAVGGSVSSMSSAGVIGMIRPVAGRMYLTRLCIQVNPTESGESLQLSFRLIMYTVYALFLFLLYTNIGCYIQRSTSPGLDLTASQSNARKRQAVRMLATATMVMILSYFPYMTVVSKLLFSKPGYYSSVFAIEIFCNIFSALNHAVNPFIYCALSSQFREGFQKWFALMRRSGSSALEDVASIKRRSKKVSASGLLKENFSNMEGNTGKANTSEKIAKSCSQLTLETIGKPASD